MKTILKMIAGLMVGMAAGLLIALAGLWIFNRMTPSEFFAKVCDVKMAEMLLVGVECMVCFLVSVFVLVLVHEAGHLVCGLLTGYRFVSFRIFNYVFIKVDGKIRVKRFGIEGTGGQCLLSPPDLPDAEISTGWYNCGGVLANVIVFFAAVPLLFSSHPLVAANAVVFMITDLLLIMINGIPMKLGGMGNDAYNMLHLRHDLAAKHGLVCQLRSNATTQNGVRPKDMPEEWFEVEGNTDYSNPLEVAVPLMRASRLLDMEQYDRALSAFEDLYDHRDKIIGIYVKEIACELSYLYLVSGRIDEASAILDKDLMKYVETYRSLMSSKERLMCAIALFMDKDADRALEIYNTLGSRKEEYLLQGEVKSDLALMHTMLEKAGVISQASRS